jgi:hypothetical protein
MQGWSKGTIYTAVGLVGLGGLLIALAWNGAASIGGPIAGLDYTQGQIPFLISGGIGGLALVGAGLAMVIVHSVRRDLLLLGLKLDQVVEAIRESGVGSVGPTAVPTEGARVAASRTTYHDLDCHIVEGREDMQLMAPDDARDRGLAACRVCKPNENAEEAAG